MPNTPGPWRVERRYSNGCEIVPRIMCEPDADRQCGWIADAIGAPYLGHESTLPNARLIAAAPDLLAALKRARMVMCVEGENDLEEWNAVLAEVEAAIKATGEEL